MLIFSSIMEASVWEVDGDQDAHLFNNQTPSFLYEKSILSLRRDSRSVRSVLTVFYSYFHHFTFFSPKKIFRKIKQIKQIMMGYQNRFGPVLGINKKNYTISTRNSHYGSLCIISLHWRLYYLKCFSYFIENICSIWEHIDTIESTGRKNDSKSDSSDSFSESNSETKISMRCFFLC